MVPLQKQPEPEKLHLVPLESCHLGTAFTTVQGISNNSINLVNITMCTRIMLKHGLTNIFRFHCLNKAREIRKKYLHQDGYVFLVQFKHSRLITGLNTGSHPC